MRIFLKRKWPLIGLVFLLALVAFYFLRSGTKVFQNPVLKDIISGEGLELKDVHYSHDDPDKGIKWNLDAKKVRFSGDKSKIFFNDFRLKVEPNNRAWVEIQGKKADYHRNSGKIYLWGDLKGYSGDGYRIDTDQMMINEKNGCMSTEKPVMISGPFFSVRGRGLFADLEKETVKILSDVTTTIHKEYLS